MSHELSLAKLLESVGLGPSMNKQADRARVVTHEMRCQTFATTFLKTFSIEEAYRATHPFVAEGRRQRRWITRRAAKWLAKPRVVQLVQQMWDQVTSQHQLDMRLIYGNIKEDTQATIVPYLSVNEEGYANGIRFKPNELTPAQARAIKSFKVRPTRYGNVVEFQMVDRQRAQELFIHATEVLQQLGNVGEGGSVPAELMRSLETLEDRRAQLYKALPPSRVRIIEGESTPV